MNEEGPTAPAQVTAATLVDQEGYGPMVRRAFMGASRSIDIAMFLADARPSMPRFHEQMLLMHLLGVARAQGVRIRVLVSNARLARPDRSANETFVRLLRLRDVEAHVFSARSLHAKLIVVDEKTVFIGSQNLTQTSAMNRELTLAYDSPAVASLAAQWFSYLWSHRSD